MILSLLLDIFVQSPTFKVDLCVMIRLLSREDLPINTELLKPFMCNLYSEPGLCNMEIISVKLVTFDLFIAHQKRSPCSPPWLVSVCLPVDTSKSIARDRFHCTTKKRKYILTKYFDTF